jgi:hypothetical protein
METKEGNKKTDKPFVIANPIYDTVFKRLMENQRIAKFFLSAILKQQVKDITVLPQKVINQTKVFKLDFIATVLTDEGVTRKILIELLKAWDMMDIILFRGNIEEQRIIKEDIDGRLPIYILGKNLAGIDCPCVKVGHKYIDMSSKKLIDTKSKFLESLSSDCYIIQICRITDMCYNTNLNKLLGIFEQNHFFEKNSDTRKEYHYNPKEEEEDMMLIVNILYEMGADSEKRKLIEDEKEALRINNAMIY